MKFSESKPSIMKTDELKLHLLTECKKFGELFNINKRLQAAILYNLGKQIEQEFTKATN